MKIFLNNSIFLALVLVLMHVVPVHAKEIIKINDIEEISLSEIGVLNHKNGGLPVDMWHSARGKFIESLLISLPQQIPSKIGQELRKRLLLTSAIPPKQVGVDVSSMLTIRLKLLASLGERENIRKLMAMIPADKLNEGLIQIYAASTFIADDYKRACSDVKKYIQQYQSVYWRKALIICDASAQSDSKVSLNLSLLTEDGHQLSPEYKTIIESFATGDSYQAKIEWSNFLKNSVLEMPKILSSFPDLKKLDKSPIDYSKIIKWFDDNKDLTQNEKIQKSVELYATIDALGVDIEKSDWEQFIMYAISNGAQIPSLAVVKILQGGATSGEVVLLTLHTLSQHPAKDMPHNMLIQITKALKNAGLHDEALQLVEETI